ncbi:DMT family transporter [Halodesulfovibrio marinisediminis]|uniref:Permease of the drug/metabolite transporter (DMT) superfamily n=1 Tax=Halodesulfovibrio marinisediminis DSM 17456 TaxID=1121457 RepID=A0A1N6I6Z1_9BACT|nr:DMT family transporter [Halodesulfovibrio marinisediminis]SIO27802.1 Permease of the drug/metabolite transporter (DMT) superfamily [Halodesulfovibrio marinisediminis DSM 17456]
MNIPPQLARYGGYLFALMATVIWSGNFIIARGLSNEIAPVTLAFCRWTTAMIALLPFAASVMFRQRKEIFASLRHLIPTAFLGVTVFNTIIYIAGHKTTALNLSLIAIISPVFIIILAHIFLNDRVTLTRLGGVALSVFGVVLLTTRGDLGLLLQLQFNEGDLLMLFATFIFAVYTILVRRKPVTISPTAYLGANFVLGWIMLLPWVLWEWTYAPLVMPAPHVLGVFLYIGVGASLLAYLFWNYAIAAIGPAKSAIVYYSLPLFCGIEAWLILGETITWVHGLSGLLIVCGIVIANRQ